MANDPKQDQAVEESVVEETTQDSSPQSEVQETEQTPTEVSTEPEAQETEEEVSVDEGMNEKQRKAFQDMRLRNKQLEEKLKTETVERTKNESAFDMFRRSEQPTSVNADSYRDPYTGQVDWTRYNQDVQAVATRNAQIEARNTVNQELDEYKARNKHPELFSDPVMEEEIAAKYLFEIARGNQVTVEQVSDLIAAKYSKAVSQAEKAGEKKALTELTPKEAASLQARGQTSSQSHAQVSSEQEEAIRRQIRSGGKAGEEALAEAFRQAREGRQ